MHAAARYCGRGATQRCLHARDAAGQTALHCAALEGRLEAAALLLLRGASIDEAERGAPEPQGLSVCSRPSYEYENTDTRHSCATVCVSVSAKARAEQLSLCVPCATMNYS